MIKFILFFFLFLLTLGLIIESGINFILGRIEKYKWTKDFIIFLITLRRVLIALVITATSFIGVIILSKLQLPLFNSLFLQTILIGLFSFILYKVYLSSQIKKFLSNIEFKTNKYINIKVFKNETAVTKLDENMSILERNSLIDKMIVVYLDSFVLIITVLSIMLTTPFISPFMQDDNGKPDIYKYYIFILILISVVVAKIHANHEKEELKEK